MKTNIINWFRISNWHELKLQYRLVDVSIDGAGNDTKQYNKAFFNALNHLAYSTKGPVSHAYHEGKRYIAVKADAELKEMIIPGSPLNAKLTPIEGVFTLTPKTMCSENLDLALRFLESSIKYQFNKNKNLWDGGNNTFLKKMPLRQSKEIQTDIYHGFKFRLVAEDKDNVFFCIDLAYKYADKYTLHEVLKQLPKERHSEYVNGKNFLYLNGDDWYTVKGKSVGVSVDKHLMAINGKNISVFDYISNEGKYAGARFRASLFKHSETFFHAYSHNSVNSYAGAACLAKAIHTADNDLHKLSINDPNSRFMRVEYHVKNYFQQLKFNGIILQVNTKPHEKEAKVFELPSLKFGNQVILNPYQGIVKYGNPIDHFPKRRREFVYNNGIITDSAFTPQYLFVPDNMPFSFGKSVKFYFDRLLKQIAPQFPGFVIHQYSMKSYPFATKVYTDLKKDIESKGLAGGNALFILPESKGNGDRFNKFLHNIIKKEFFDTVKIKCVSARSLQRYLKPGADKFGNHIYFVPDSLMRDFKSYQANTLFEHLIINRKWPYALAENLNHDLYIGIDAHDFYAGFVFFFKNGEKIVFDTEKVVKSIGSFRNEKISYKVIEEKIVSVLTRHIKVGEEIPKSIVILRDGVSYGEEEKALSGALKRLTNLNLVKGNEIKTGVVDVAKSSAVPVRAAEFVGKSNSLENPVSGTHFYMNSKDAFIFNTGAPYKVPGSSNPIHVSYSSGNIDFDKALEDIFRLTQITFSSPDRPTSLPLPLKLIDTLIRDVAHEYDYVTTQDKEIKIHEPSLN
jgi:hypothetical protein